MDYYLEILQEKANKICADISECGYDKDCIKDILALKVRTNLESEDIKTIKEKANEIEANFKENDNKETILEAIEKKVKEILEKENERFTSMQLQQDFIPLDLA